MQVYECPQRDMELRLNDDEKLEGDKRFCPTHYVPLVKREHPAGQSREWYETKDGGTVWRSAQEPGLKAYEHEGAK